MDEVYESACDSYQIGVALLFVLANETCSHDWQVTVCMSDLII